MNCEQQFQEWLLTYLEKRPRTVNQKDMKDAWLASHAATKQQCAKLALDFGENGAKSLRAYEACEKIAQRIEQMP